MIDIPQVLCRVPRTTQNNHERKCMENPMVVEWIKLDQKVKPGIAEIAAAIRSINTWTTASFLKKSATAQERRAGSSPPGGFKCSATASIRSISL